LAHFLKSYTLVGTFFEELQITNNTKSWLCFGLVALQENENYKNKSPLAYVRHPRKSCPLDRWNLWGEKKQN
jgi:hypothetical protein